MITYFTQFGKDTAFRFRKRQVNSGIEPDRGEVKDKMEILKFMRKELKLLHKQIFH